MLFSQLMVVGELSGDFGLISSAMLIFKVAG
jgi:hypothetical protein